MGMISGVCRHPSTGAPGAYRVFASDYYTGELFGFADSDPVTGAYSIPVPDNARVRTVRVNAPLVEAGSNLMLGLPMTGTGGVFDELVGGHGVSAYNVEQAADGSAPGGRCAVFDAPDKHLQVGYDPRLVFSGPFEVGFKLKFSTLAAGEIFAWSSGYGIVICNSSGVVSFVGDDWASGAIGTAAVGDWHQYTVSRDAAGMVRKFFDGDLIDATESAGTTYGFDAGSGFLGIGRWPGDSTTTLRASMAGFYMADRAIHTASFTPSAEIPDGVYYSLGAPFEASEIADYIETLAF